LAGTTATELIPQENDILAQPPTELQTTKLGYAFHQISSGDFNPLETVKLRAAFCTGSLGSRISRSPQNCDLFRL
jgi:hypothetical protein